MATKTPTFVDPFDDAETRVRAGRLGMWIFLAVVVMVFGAAILGYLVVRLEPEKPRPWKSWNSPGLPWTLLLSTGAILGVSAVMHLARLAAVKDRARACGRWMAAAFGLAISFLILQAWSWERLWSQDVRITDSLYAWTFYVLTGLHAVHVIAGLPPLVIVAVRAMRGRYGAGRNSGLVLCGMYWHTIDAIWLVLYLTLWLGS